jgi:hypothetical protein
MRLDGRNTDSWNPFIDSSNVKRVLNTLELSALETKKYGHITGFPMDDKMHQQHGRAAIL